MSGSDCTTETHVRAVIAAEAIQQLIRSCADIEVGGSDLPDEDLTILRAAQTIAVMLGPPSLQMALKKS